jgi:hypothetical protein
LIVFCKTKIIALSPPKINIHIEIKIDMSKQFINPKIDFPGLPITSGRIRGSRLIQDMITESENEEFQVARQNAH